MIQLELYGDKQLKVKNMHKIFVGENNFDSINIQCMDSKIGDHNVSDCEFTAHVVFPDQSYLEYTLTWSETGAASIPISKDLTGTEQKLKLFIEITSSGDTLGDTSKVELTVENIVREASRILKQADLISLFQNITDEKVTYVNLGTTSDVTVFDDNTDCKKVYSVIYNGASYLFFRLQGSTIQYRFSGNGIEARSTTELTWTNLTQNRVEYVGLGTSSSSSVFDDNTDYKKLYSVTYNSTGYLFFTLQDTTIQFRFSGNGIEARSTTELTWTNLTQNRVEYVGLGTSSSSSVFDDNTDYKKLYSVTYNSTGYLFFILQGTTIQFRFSGNGIEVRSTTESTWHNLTSRDTVPTENSTNLITSGAVFAALLGKLNFKEVDSSASATTFDDNIENGVLYQGYVVDNYYSWLTLAVSGIPLFQFRFSESGIELRTYDVINGWTIFQNICEPITVDTSTLVTEAMLQTTAYKNSTKDYYIRLAADVLFTGQTAGLGIRLINVNNTQYALTDGSGIYYRQSSNAWQSIS